ncbi:MAG: hypothetical protein J5779_02140 [Clostridia bacterium]|nr:hypothetical protein [Clostridia bacterium]
MDFYCVNFKDLIISADDTEIYLDMEIEKAKQAKALAFKILHGYGSHGRGGKICINLRKCLLKLRNKGKIKDFFIGSEWAIENPKCFEFLKTCKFASLDEDIGKQNPGITIVVL